MEKYTLNVFGKDTSLEADNENVYSSGSNRQADRPPASREYTHQ